MACNKQFENLFTILDKSNYEINTPFKKVIQEAVEKAGFCDQKVEETDTAQKGKTKENKGVKVKAASKKPRKLTGYNLFTRAKMPEVKANEKIEGKDRIKEIARMWKALDQEGKDKWNAQAKELPTPKPKK